MGRYKVLIAVVVLLSFMLVLFFVFKDTLLNTDRVVENKPEVENMVNISQAEVSAFLFATQESEHDHRLHICFTPFLTFDVNDASVEKILIENMKGESNLGEVIYIHPTTLSTDVVSRTFLFTDTSEPIKGEDIFSKGDSIEYIAVDIVTNYTQVLKHGSLNPHLTLVLKDIGTVDYKAVVDRDGEFLGSKYLEYSGIDVNDLNTNVQFDVKIYFDTGEIYVKRFKGYLEGLRFETEVAPLFTLETVLE